MKLRFPGGLKNALTFSYDDGVEQDIELIRLMNERGLKGTFNLNSGLWAAPGFTWPAGQIHRRLSLEAAQALYPASGHEIAAHCLTHASLPELDDAGILRETLQDRLNLEAQFGTLVQGMAYPYGTYDGRTAQLLGSCGIRYCRTVSSTHSFDLPKNWLTLHPTCHHDDPVLFDLIDTFLTPHPMGNPRLFYIWGHAYEFEANHNFDRFEQLGDRLAGREDIWYATNIDICTYADAFRRLVFSADHARVYNPSARAVWLEENGRTVCAGPGETVRLDA